MHKATMGNSKFNHTPRSSLGATWSMRTRCRYKKGYKNVIDKALELNARGVDCQMAIEVSGHGALRENHMLDDGAYMAMKVRAIE
jgi:Phosphoglucomutase/phosphomannomutase, alpha/beta/alpha domain III